MYLKFTNMSVVFASHCAYINIQIPDLKICEFLICKVLHLGYGNSHIGQLRICKFLNLRICEVADFKISYFHIAYLLIEFHDNSQRFLQLILFSMIDLYL